MKEKVGNPYNNLLPLLLSLLLLLCNICSYMKRQGGPMHWRRWAWWARVWWWSPCGREAPQLTHRGLPLEGVVHLEEEDNMIRTALPCMWFRHYVLVILLNHVRPSDTHVHVFYIYDFCSHDIVQHEACFVLKCPVYNDVRNMFYSLSHNVILGGLKRSCQLDPQLHITSHYLTDFTALCLVL